MHDVVTLPPHLSAQSKRPPSLALTATAAADSHVGWVRDNNEDAFLIDEELGLFAVADGMGGVAGGEVASAVALEAARRSVAGDASIVEAVADTILAPSVLAEVAHRAVAAANRAVYAMAGQDASLHGMGSTLTALIVAGNHACAGHVGDSRGYLQRGGKLRRLTHDHTYAEELVRMGALAPRRAERHPYRHVLTRVVGTKPRVRIDTRVVALAEDDRLLLCSDGLSEYLPGPEWLSLMLSIGRADETVSQLIDHALESGGRDNVTVLIADLQCASNALGSSGIRRCPDGLRLP